METTTRNASKWGKPNRKPNHLYDFWNPYKTIQQSINEEHSLKFVHEYHFVERQKETSNLRKLKIMPRNRNESVLSWIPPRGSVICREYNISLSVTNKFEVSNVYLLEQIPNVYKERLLGADWGAMDT